MDILVSLFGPVLARLWVAAVSVTVTIYLMELIRRATPIKKRKRKKKFHPYLRAQLVKAPSWPPKVNLN